MELKGRSLSLLRSAPDEFLDKCPICGSANYSIVYNVGAVYNEPDDLTKITSNICHTCSVIFSNPRISEQIINKFYVEEMGELHNNQSLDKLKNQEPKALTKIRINLLTKYLKGESKFLEIGGGSLNFIVTLAKQFPNIQFDEIDPSLPDCTKLDENLSVYNYFADEKLPIKLSGLYDIVAAFHVLEHQHNPYLFIETIKSLLKPKGIIYVEVPYPFSPFWQRKRIDGCFRTVHQFNYTQNSLRYLLNKCGFTIVEVDISSLSMVRIIATNEKQTNVIDNVKDSDITKAKRYIDLWILYSKFAKLGGLSFIAETFAKVVWKLNKGINEL